MRRYFAGIGLLFMGIIGGVSCVAGDDPAETESEGIGGASQEAGGAQDRTRQPQARPVVGASPETEVGEPPIVVAAKGLGNGVHRLKDATDRAPHDTNEPPGASDPNGIAYHGGPVMTNTVNVYYIWYGNWAGNNATEILDELAGNIGGSPYYFINATYTDLFGKHINGQVKFAQQTFNGYSRGANLTDADIFPIVSQAITGGALPLDPNGVYFVLTSADVHENSGFCTYFCGWHTHASLSGVDVKYSFVGNPDTQCPYACEYQHTSSPNNNPGADGMASVIIHELEEAATDPDLNAWYDSSGEENADKCAWTFGTTYKAANGSTANMKLGCRDYLIQQNWVNANGGFCALKLPTCGHDECATGGAIASNCNQCTSNVCAYDPYCCTTGWDSQCVSEVATYCGAHYCQASCTNVHSPCATGAPLNSGSSSCATSVCAHDPYCCTTAWDSICVGEVPSYCGFNCNSSCSHSECTTGGSLANGCNFCVSKVCAKDPYCCTSAWDSLCVSEVATYCSYSCQ